MLSFWSSAKNLSFNKELHYRIYGIKVKLLYQMTIFFDQSNLKGFEDYKMHVTQIYEFVFERVEHIVRKGENTKYQHFFILPHCF